MTTPIQNPPSFQITPQEIKAFQCLIDPQKEPASASPSFYKDPSSLRKLEQRAYESTKSQGRGWEGIQDSLTYMAGFVDGLNPLTPLQDRIKEAFQIEKKPPGNPEKYWEGRMDGSLTGMGMDATLIGGGGTVAVGSVECAAVTVGGCIPVAGPGVVVGGTMTVTGTALLPLHGTTYETAKEKYLQSRAKQNQGVNSTSSTSSQGSPSIKPEELTGKTRTEIRDLADQKGFKPYGDKKSPDYPRKWKDPITGKERLRLDRGHVDEKTGKPFDHPHAAADHAHGYESSGAKITDPATKDPHFPTTGE